MERHPAMSAGTAFSSRLNSTVGSMKNSTTARAMPSTEATAIITPVIFSPRWSFSHLSRPVSSSSSSPSVSLSAERDSAL